MVQIQMPNLLRNTSAREFKLAELKPLSALHRMLAASVLLRCPHCACGGLYAGGFRLHQRCPVCGAKFERDGGEWTGALWLSQWFGLTLGIALWAFLHFRGYQIPALPVVVAGVMSLAMAATYRNIKGWWVWFLYMTGFVYPEPIPEKERPK
jgi:uncharacterized protein (DUF983 family)